MGGMGSVMTSVWHVITPPSAEPLGKSLLKAQAYIHYSPMTRLLLPALLQGPLQADDMARENMGREHNYKTQAFQTPHWCIEDIKTEPLSLERVEMDHEASLG